jgi:hypothetical protein
MAANKQATENHQDDENSPNWKTIGARGAATVGKLAMDLKQLANAQEKFTVVDKLSNMIKSGSCSVSTLRDQFSKIIGDDPQQCPVLKKMLDNDCICSEKIADVMGELLQFKKAFAENIVIIGAISSSVLIVIQVIKLYQVFSEVSGASNILNESKLEFESIRQNIERLGQWCTELQDMMSNYEMASTQDQQLIPGRINGKVRRINSLYVKTQSMICALKLKINGKIHTLTIYRGEQGMDAISSLVQGATNTVQLMQLGELLSSPIFALQATITTAFFALATASTAACYMTHKKLDELRNVMNEIKRMEMELDTILHKINAAEDWLDEHR